MNEPNPSTYRSNFGYHERRLAIAVAEALNLRGGVGGGGQVDYQLLAEAIGTALERNKEPIHEVRNLSFSSRAWGRYFYASRQPGQIVEIVHQALTTTTQRLWILLFDQAEGPPVEPGSGEPGVRFQIIGFVGKGSLPSNGNVWGYDFDNGLKFENGILACISTSEFEYQPPDFAELSVSIKFYGTPCHDEVFDLASPPP